MGVQTFLLDRRAASILIGTSRQTVGTLRTFFKVTELNEERAAELAAAAAITPSPIAVMVNAISDLPLATAPDQPVAAHLVLGWDEGRGSVTDFGWDYLPQLGYAVRDPSHGAYILHEERDGLLYLIDDHRARVLGVVDAHGQLIPHGQPRIIKCQAVKPYIPGYAEADCTFDGGSTDKILVVTPEGQLPPASWFVGKRPLDVARYQQNVVRPAGP